ncbi:MAG: hypothetical protein LEGION0403_FIIPPAGN_02400 [Legionella sp.]|uniref:conjugative transfer signal peptidase TraF n=1 Tax=Legionella sp. TaxID=459 RepID=UPI003D0C1892
MKKISVWICISCAGLFCFLVFLFLVGIKFNISDSIPKGIYRVHQGEIKRNSFVLFCPDDREAFRLGKRRGYLNHGFCSNDYGYVMKQVVALAGDEVSSTDKGVFVNHRQIRFSQPHIHDGFNRPMPLWRVKKYTLQAGELVTMTNQNSLSFDSRYFGLIQVKQVKGIIDPVFIW